MTNSVPRNQDPQAERVPSRANWSRSSNMENLGILWRLQITDDPLAGREIAKQHKLLSWIHRQSDGLSRTYGLSSSFDEALKRQ